MLEAFVVLLNSVAIGFMHLIMTDSGEPLGKLKLWFYSKDIFFISKVMTCSKCFAGWSAIISCILCAVEFQYFFPIVGLTMFIVWTQECKK